VQLGLVELRCSTISWLFPKYRATVKDNARESSRISLLDINETRAAMRYRDNV
jgi:hypothetical protein